MTEINFFLLLLLSALIGAVVVRFSTKRQMLIQYPILMALVCAGWVMPQLIGLYVTEQVPPDALAKTLVFILLCIVAGIWGFSATRRVFPMAQWELSTDRLQIGALLLMLFGLYFYQRVSELAPEMTRLNGGFWTGQITIFVFFSTTLTLGFICALAANIQRPTILNRAMILVGLVMLLERVVIYGRREEAIELFTVLLLYLWRKYGWLPGRWMFFGATVAGALFVNAIGSYRNLMIDPNTNDWSGATLLDILSIDFIGNFYNVSNDPAANSELKNAVLNIGSTDIRMAFDGGLSLWNHLVFSFVPAQIFGAELKQSLMVTLPDNAYIVYSHSPWPGSTPTGFSTAFESFWYPGAIIFFVIGYIMRRWTNAFLRGSTTGMIMLMLLTSQSLISITHLTHLFFSVFISIGVFVMPVLLYARVRPRRINQPLEAPQAFLRPRVRSAPERLAPDSRGCGNG